MNPNRQKENSASEATNSLFANFVGIIVVGTVAVVIFLLWSGPTTYIASSHVISIMGVIAALSIALQVYLFNLMRHLDSMDLANPSLQLSRAQLSRLVLQVDMIVIILISLLFLNSALLSAIVNEYLRSGFEGEPSFVKEPSFSGLLTLGVRLIGDPQLWLGVIMMVFLAFTLGTFRTDNFVRTVQIMDRIASQSINASSARYTHLLIKDGWRELGRNHTPGKATKEYHKSVAIMFGVFFFALLVISLFILEEPSGALAFSVVATFSLVGTAFSVVALEALAEIVCKCGVYRKVRRRKLMQASIRVLLQVLFVNCLVFLFFTTIVVGSGFAAYSLAGVGELIGASVPIILNVIIFFTGRHREVGFENILRKFGEFS